MITTLTYQEAVEKCPAIAATAPSSKCSKKYAFIPTSEIVKSALDNDWVIRDTKQGRGTFGIHSVTLIHKSQLSAKIEEGFPQINIINSHNLSKRFTAALGYFRLVCSNGLIAPVGLFNSTTTLHRQKTGEEDLFTSIIPSLEQGFSSYGIITAKVEQMKDRNLSDREKTLLARYANYIRFRYRMLQPKKFDPAAVLKPRRVVDNGNDLWRTFNTIQENISRGGNGIGSGITQFQDDLRFNQEFWAGVDKALVHQEEDLEIELKKLFPKTPRPRKQNLS